jgi:hypothetical protein
MINSKKIIRKKEKKFQVTVVKNKKNQENLFSNLFINSLFIRYHSEKSICQTKFFFINDEPIKEGVSDKELSDYLKKH